MLVLRTTVFPLGPPALLFIWAAVVKAGKREAYLTASKLSLFWIEMILTAGKGSTIRNWRFVQRINVHSERNPFIPSMPVSTSIVQTFSCETIDGEHFLRAQLTLSCDQSSARRRSWEICMC